MSDHDGHEGTANDSGRISVLDERFRKVLGPDSRLLHLSDGGRWTEGPAWWPREDCLVWSDVENDSILRWSEQGGVSVLRAPSSFANGNAVDPEGRLIHCEHGRRCISRTEDDGEVVVLVDRYEGRRFNSPNDLTVAPDGAIWFSDPTFGITNPDQGYPATPELPHRSVYRFDPADGTLLRAADFEQPNGLAFSPDGRVLYVSDTSRAKREDGLHGIYAFDVEDGRALRNRRLFREVEPGVPDGFCIDDRGWVYSSSGSGVQVFSDSGELLAHIPTPLTCSNCTFGGTNGSRLFMTASEDLFALDLLPLGR